MVEEPQVDVTLQRAAVEAASGYCAWSTKAADWTGAACVIRMQIMAAAALEGLQGWNPGDVGLTRRAAESLEQASVSVSPLSGARGKETEKEVEMAGHTATPTAGAPEGGVTPSPPPPALGQESVSTG